MITFTSAIDNFADTMEALRRFIASLGPVLVEREAAAAKEFAPVIGKFSLALLLTGELTDPNLIPEEVRAPLESLREQFQRMAVKIHPDGPSQLPESIRKHVPIKFVNGKAEVDWEVPDAVNVLPARRELDALKRGLRLLHESALMVLTSRSELLVAQLFHLFFDKHPTAAGTSESFFSLDTLSSMQSLDEARGILIEHKVEALMRESFPEWMKFFKEKPKLGMGYMSSEMDRIGEIFKRRNLVVHNGGVTNRRYCQDVSDDLRQNAKLGDTVEVSPNYLNSAIGIFEHQFVLLAAELWKKLFPTDEERGRLLMYRAVRHLEMKSWSVARGFSYFGMNDMELPETVRLSNQINYWQSFKWPGEYELIRAEVEKADYSAKAPLYRLAHAAVKSDFQYCFNSLPNALENHQLSKLELNTWPVFQELREQPEFAKYKLAVETNSPPPSGPPTQGANPEGPVN